MGTGTRTSPDPVRAVLLVTALAVLAVVGAYLAVRYERSTWSEDELRSAVRSAAEDLESDPGMKSAFSNRPPLIEFAVGAAGGDDAPFDDVEVVETGSGGSYTIGSDDTAAVFCMRVTGAARGATDGESPVPERDLTIEVGEGPC